MVGNTVKLNFKTVGMCGATDRRREFSRLYVHLKIGNTNTSVHFCVMTK